MKKLYMLLTLIMAFFLLTPIAIAQGPIKSFDQAKDSCIREGVEAVEVIQTRDPGGNIVTLSFPYKVIKKAGIGVWGFWTFYTLKYYPSVDSVVILIYKPEFGSVIILRRDYGLYWGILEQEHGLIVWELYDLSKEASDGMVCVLLKPMDRLVNNPNWEFTPTEEMRPDLCWKVEGKIKK
jgi:hypothetical protein